MSYKKLLFLLPVLVSTVLLAAPAKAQVVLPFFEDFEDTNGETYLTTTAALAGAPEWRFDPQSGGRLRMAAGPLFPRNGTGAATVDRAAIGAFITNFLTATLDLSTYDANVDVIVLDFSVMHHGEEDDPDDRVWVRGSNTDAYVQIGDLIALTGSAGVYSDVTDLDVSGALVSAGQNFSSTFQVRFGQYDDFPATSITSTDGFTFDDIRIRRVLNDDVGVSAVIAPLVEVCGVASQDIVVQVTNFGANTQSDINLQVVLTGAFTDTFDVVVPGPLTANQSVMVTAGTIDSLTGGDVTITATTGLGADEDNANDAASGMVTIRPAAVPFIAPNAVCPGDPGVIDINQETESEYLLFAAQSGGLSLGSGATTVMTPPIDVDTTFYLERANAPVGVGPIDDTIGTSGPYVTFTDGLRFNALTDVMLEGVHVYPAGTGVVKIRLLSPAGTVLATSSEVTIAAGDVDMKTFIPLDFTVLAGSGYRLDAVGSTVSALMRNSDGASYPYTSSKLVISGPNNSLVDIFYFFYDWSYVSLGDTCSTPRTAVDLVVDSAACTADLELTLDAPAEIEVGESLDYTITVTNNGPTGASNVTVDLTAPSGVTFIGNGGACTDAFPCNMGGLASGESAVMTGVFTVDAGASGVLSATASVTSDTPEASPGDESDSASTTVTDGGGVGGAGGGVGPGGSGGEPAGSGGMGGAGPTTTTSTGGGGDEPPPDEGCSCAAPGEQHDTNYPWLVLSGLALGLWRRRRVAS